MISLKKGLIPALKADSDHSCADDGLPLIEAVNLSVKYMGDAVKSDDFKSLVHKSLRSRRSKKREAFWALNDLSFCGYPGDVIGVIGANGAGKTTLCRVILSMLRPNRGSIIVRGEVSSLLSLGSGFNDELTGRENIILNGMMLGLSRKRLNELLPSIEEFSGLGRFLAEPIKYYSSGMKARLGFSIAVALKADILVIDEVLGTGDLEFRERAVKKLWELVGGASMVVVVSHDLNFITENCNRAIWLDQGKLKALGEPEQVVAQYKETIPRVALPKKQKIVSFQETKTEAGKNAAIEVKSLGIKFKVGKKPFWALKDVSFTMYDQEIIGIIGPNGAGKTTLCRTLCGLYRPDSGSVQIAGKISALLSLGTGFNEHLSGWDNIYLNGMMLGIPRKVIRGIEDEIVEFAELEKFIHRPVKQYSSGMKSRLGFSIAAMLKPDILIVDEALSAGDLAFQEKATMKMQEMLEEAKAVVIVTHSLEIVEKVCNRAIWLQSGEVKYDGEPADTVRLYKEMASEHKNKVVR